MKADVEKIHHLIYLCFGILVFLTPLIFLPYTSEVFQIPKMLFVYFATGLIVILWSIKIWQLKKIKLNRTFADAPLIVFIFTMLVATLFSVDLYTSFVGYPSRLNGSLLSIISYALLYWAFVNNIPREKIKSLFTAGAVATGISAFYAILQWFGIDSSIWDTSTLRVFSTFGQPNWLGVWLAASLPLSISGYFYAKPKYKKWLGILTVIGFVALILTRSKSALLGLLVALLVISFKQNRLVKVLFGAGLALLLFGQLFIRTISPENPGALDITPSGNLRLIVWEGGLKMFMERPLFGFGPESFAYVYPQFRPVRHNLTSEWEFIYNKAHNEYLNYLATSGIMGFMGFIILLAAFFYQFKKALRTNKHQPLLRAIFAGWIAVVVAIFFGFTTPSSSLILFLFPATAALYYKPKSLEVGRFISIALIASGLVFIVFAVAYFASDVLYAQSRALNDQARYGDAQTKITQALRLNPYSPLYLAHKAQVLTNLADTLKSTDLSGEIHSLYQKAIDISPRNPLLYESAAASTIRLAALDADSPKSPQDYYLKALELSPTNPSPYYKYALYLHTKGDLPQAVNYLNQSLELKPNYKQARLALGIIYEASGMPEMARQQYLYVLEKINADDKDAIRFLDALKHE